jgi:hypothetical protein
MHPTAHILNTNAHCYLRVIDTCAIMPPSKHKHILLPEIHASLYT